MNESELLRFLLEAHRHGYAAGREAVTRAEPNRSTTIEHRRGEWTFHDNFFGGEPYGGRAVVFFRERPVWMVVYYGWLEDRARAVQPVYDFLKRALLRAPESLPFRGPDHHAEGTLIYRNARRGTVARFDGEEVIEDDGRRIYAARYAGGAVDRAGGA
jgi:hypothetical protein